VKRGWRAIVEGKSHYRKIRPNAISNIGSDSLYHAQDTERLHPEDPQAPIPKRAVAINRTASIFYLNPGLVRRIVFMAIQFL